MLMRCYRRIGAECAWSLASAEYGSQGEDMPGRDSYHVVLSAGAGTIRRLVYGAAVVCVAVACRDGNKKPPPPNSPWLTYSPDASHPEFAAQVRAITFAPNTPAHYPVRADSLPIHLTIAPEASVSKLEGKPDGSIATDAPTTGTYPVRVMAIIGNADTTTLPDLPLQPNMPDSVIIWWVDASGGATTWKKWRSHYVLVDTNHTHQSPVIQPLATDSAFAWHADSTVPSAPSADWDKHLDFMLADALIHGGARGTFKKVGNSSWVSCGGGCCNGAVH
jgi:hypothetical protein